MPLRASRSSPTSTRLGTQNAHGELYLTDMAAILGAAGERVLALQAENADEVLGANTIAEMMTIDDKLRLSTARRLMAEGVTIFRPETSVIDAGVMVGADTVIEPFVQLLGETKVGKECRIRSYSVLEHATLGTGCWFAKAASSAKSRVDDGALLGPYAHIRPESEIGEGAHVGNFVETKKIRLGKGSKANHLTYLGDAEIGAGVNVGAGVITCNYDGVNKLKTIIGDHVFVGSDSTLVAPVTLGNGSYIAAGSCITEDVPEDALALGRARQTIKEGWSAKRRNKKKVVRSGSFGRELARQAPGRGECGRKSRRVAPAPQEYRAGGDRRRGIAFHVTQQEQQALVWRAGCAPQPQDRDGAHCDDSGRLPEKSPRGFFLFQRKSLAQLVDQCRIHSEPIGLLALLEGTDKGGGENLFRFDLVAGHVKRKGKSTMTVAFVDIALLLLAGLLSSLRDDEDSIQRKTRARN